MEKSRQRAAHRERPCSQDKAVSCPTNKLGAESTGFTSDLLSPSGHSLNVPHVPSGLVSISPHKATNETEPAMDLPCGKLPWCRNSLPVHHQGGLSRKSHGPSQDIQIKWFIKSVTKIQEARQGKKNLGHSSTRWKSHTTWCAPVLHDVCVWVHLHFSLSLSLCLPLPHQLPS